MTSSSKVYIDAQQALADVVLGSIDELVPEVV